MYKIFASTLISLLTIACASCAPVPKWDPEKEAKPYLDELTLVDQKSVKVLAFRPWEDDTSYLIFTTAKIDFADNKIEGLEKDLFPSSLYVKSIEKITSYKFTAPSDKKSVVFYNFQGNKFCMIDICVDGDCYVCKLTVKKPKIKKEAPATNPHK